MILSSRGNIFNFRWSRILSTMCFLFLAGLVFTAKGQMQFEDVTINAGGFASGERWGASWGDLNGDRRPDLFVGNHRDRAALWLNNGDGTFIDVLGQSDTAGLLVDDPKHDTHGSTWVDFDNDGDQDVYITTTGRDGRLMVNNNGFLTDQAVNSDLQQDGAGRLPAWFDYNNDGFLDVFLFNFGDVIVNIHDPNDFVGDFDSVTRSSLGVSCRNDNYGQFSDLNNDGRMELICGREGVFPENIYDTSTIPFNNITSSFPTQGLTVDSVIADFDRDLRPDVFMVRGRLRPTQALKVADDRVEAWVSVSGSSGEKGFRFPATGVLTVDVDWNYSDSRIHVGAGGLVPSSVPFTLDPADTNTHGVNSGTSYGTYIGYDPVAGEWEILLRPQSTGRRAYFIVESDGTVSDPEVINLQGIDQPKKPRLVMNSLSGFQEEGNSRGFNENVWCISGVAADFDNDMDEDLYLICRGGVQNIENRLYENQGDGSFIEVIGAGGAQGPIGEGIISGAGTAESVITADYDTDGFVDLFVTNGLLMQPIREGGPDKLFRNLGNSNHWIELDLVGTVSNRDAIGAKVYTTAGGVTQLRENNHGYHRWSQNHKRLHFGLAQNTQTDIEVRWPNGDVDNFYNMEVDQLYSITQGSSSGAGALQVATLGSVDFPPDPSGGDECGEPSYNANFDNAVLIWKDCVTNEWELRVMSGGSPTTQTFEGVISTDAGSISATPVGLEGNDVLDTSLLSQVTFKLKVINAGQDAFRFTAPETGGTTNACFQMTNLPVGAQVLLGSSKTIAPMPLDLGTLLVCTAPPGPPAECGAPSYDKSSERGVFIWKDCGGTDLWSLRATGGGSPDLIFYTGGLQSDPAAFDPPSLVSIESADIVDNVTDPTVIDYSLRMKLSGQDGFDFGIPVGATVCFAPTSLPDGGEVFLGQNREPMVGAFNLETQGTCP